MPELPPVGPPAFGLPVISPPPPRAQAPARLLTTDEEGKLRFDLDSRGRWKASSPIDQGVALSLAVPLGGIPSAPEIGNELHKISPGEAEARVRDAVNRAYPLSEYLARGLVETLEIHHQEGPHGRLLVEYRYRKTQTDETGKAFFPPRTP